MEASGLSEVLWLDCVGEVVTNLIISSRKVLCLDDDVPLGCPVNEQGSKASGGSRAGATVVDGPDGGVGISAEQDGGSLKDVGPCREGQKDRRQLEEG